MHNIYSSLLSCWIRGLLVLLAFGLTAGPAQAQFSPVMSYPTGSGTTPFYLVLRDFNGDGRLDIAETNNSTRSVGVLLAQAGGGYAPVVTYATQSPSTPFGLASGDVTGDGRPDLVVANYISGSPTTTGTVSVLPGQAGGTFGSATLVNVGGSPLNVALGDVTGDGRLDLVTSIFSGGGRVVSVVPGLGNGSFGTPAFYGGGSNSTLANQQSYGVALDDLDGDGRLDIAVTNFDQAAGYTVGVLLNQGGGGFRAPTSYITGSGNTQPTGIAIGDVNNDSRPDLIMTNYNTSTVSVLLGQTGGIFGAASTYATGAAGPRELALGDVNKDGLLDIVTANFGSGGGNGSTASVLLGLGGGSFDTAALYSVGASSSPWHVALGDLNGDGRLDIAATGRGNNTIGVLLNTTVYAAPILISINPTSAPVGRSVTLTGTNLTGATAVSFNGTAATTFSVVNATTITATVPAGATSGNVTVTTPSGTTGGLLFTVTYPDLVVNTPTTIPAGIYNSITVSSTGMGTLAGDVTVNTSLTVQSGGTLTDGCAVISGAGSFTLADGATLNICAAQGVSSSGASGAVQVTGARSFSPDASYVYNGSAAQATGDGLPSQVRNLTITNDNPVTLSAAASVLQVLTVNGIGNFVLNGNALTLLSSSAGTALVVNMGAGRVVGNTVVVQRYIDGSLNQGAGYRHYSVPVVGSTVADFTTSGFTPVVNPDYNASATPGTVRPFPTFYLYNQNRLASASNNLSTFDKGWFSPSDLTYLLYPGFGYTVNIDAGQVVDFVGGLVSTPSTTIFLERTTGPTAADGGWVLLGNPYASPLDLSLVAAADRRNVDAATYVIQSTGQYAGGYRAYVNGVSTNASNSPLLALGQGFFVRVSAGQTSGTFTFRNAQRVTTYASQAAFQRTTADTRPTVRLELAGAGRADTWVAYAEAGATPGFDGAFDAGKLANTTGLNLSSVAGAGNLAIDGRAAFTTATTLPLAVGVPAAGAYTLTAAALDNLPAGLTAYLCDAQTGQTTKLTAGTSYNFHMSAAEAQALVMGRFTVVFSPQTALATTPSLSVEAVSVYPNPAHSSFAVTMPGVTGASAVQAELVNTLGQVVRRQSAALPASGTSFSVPTAELAAGVYVLRLQAGDTTLTKRVVVQ
jgi:hypothetical protein